MGFTPSFPRIAGCFAPVFPTVALSLAPVLPAVGKALGHCFDIVGKLARAVLDAAAVRADLVIVVVAAEGEAYVIHQLPVRHVHIHIDVGQYAVLGSGSLQRLQRRGALAYVICRARRSAGDDVFKVKILQRSQQVQVADVELCKLLDALAACGADGRDELALARTYRQRARKLRHLVRLLEHLTYHRAVEIRRLHDVGHDGVDALLKRLGLGGVAVVDRHEDGILLRGQVAVVAH